MASVATPADRYSTGAIWFHWIMAALIVFNIVVGIFHDGVPALRALMPAHKAVGVTVLVLTVARIAWRLGHRPPPFAEDVTGWERSTAIAVRRIFYALMLLMPLSGWIMVSASTHPRPLSWFDAFDVPLLPVKGGDLIARGVTAGPEVARILRAVEAQWVAEDYPDAARVGAIVDQMIGRSSAPRQ